MEIRLLSLKKANSCIKVILIGVGLLMGAWWLYFPGHSRVKNLRLENSRLTDEISLLERQIEDLREDLERVGKDPYIYERIARDELGIARDGETVIDMGE